MTDFLESVGSLCERSAVALRELTRASIDGTTHRYYLAGPVDLPVNGTPRRTSFQWYVGGAVPDQQVLVRAGSEFLTYAHCLELATSLAASSVLVLQRSLSAVPLVRVHSCCTTGDLFGSERCDCGDQLRTAINAIARRGAGMLVYDASHEGRGIGLLGKMLAYALQGRGADTYAANATLGFLHDQREFGFAEAVIDAFYADQAIDLLTNNPNKLERIAEVVRTVLRVPIHGTVTSSNESYLRAKHANGHLLALDAASGRPLPALSSPAFRARRRPYSSHALGVDTSSD